MNNLCGSPDRENTSPLIELSYQTPRFQRHGRMALHGKLLFDDLIRLGHGPVYIANVHDEVSSNVVRHALVQNWGTRLHRLPRVSNSVKQLVLDID